MSKSPLLAAALGGTLLLFPSAAPATDVAANSHGRRVEVPVEVVRESLAALAERLRSADAKTAYRAERSLIRAGCLAVPAVLPYLDNWKLPAFRRALTVLSEMDWKGASMQLRRQAAGKAVRGLFMVNLRGQRFTESLLAEKALLKMGAGALPELARLARGEDDFGKWLSLTVLEKVKWGRMPYAAAREVVKALRCVECCSRHGELRKSAATILGKIRNVYGISRIDAADGGETGEGDYGQQKAA